MKVGIKKGVTLYTLKAQTVLAQTFAVAICMQHDVDFMLTSGDDRPHGKKSKHYQGLAFDMRTRHLSDAMKQTVHNELKQALGSDYDVVLEETHLHVEYDPKG